MMSSKGGFGSWKGQQENESTFDVYVARIPPDYDEAKISDLFTPIGKIKGVTLKPGKGDYTSNYAFVKFTTEEDALCAVKYMNNFQVESGNLLVSYKKKETQNSSNGGGSGFGNPVGSSGTGGFGRQTSNEKTTTRGGFTASRGRGGFNSNRGGSARSSVSNESDFDSQRDNAVTTNGFKSLSNDDTWEDEAKSSQNNLQSPSPKQNTFEEPSLVVHVDHPTKVWGQAISKENASAINKITSELNTECPKMPKIGGQLLYGKVFGCQFTEDQLWYRCKVEKHLPELGTKLKVRYIDYGNCEVVDQSSLVSLPESLSGVPPCAKEYDLGIKPVTLDENSDKFKQGVEFLKKKVMDEVVHIEKISGTNSVVQIYLKEKNDLNEAIITAGHAAAVVKQENEEKPAFVKPLTAQAVRPPRGVNSFQMSRENEDLKKKFEALQAELRDLKSSKEKKDKEYEILAQRNTQLQYAIAKSESINKSLSHSAVHHRLHNLSEKVSLLKNKRESINLDEAFSPRLKAAVDLMSDNKKSIRLDSMISYQELLKSEAQLEDDQHNVQNVADKDGLEILIQKRDGSRNELLQKVNEFLESAGNLQFDTRQRDLEFALTDIKKTYVLPAESTETSCVSNAVQAYQEWRLKKIDTVKEIQCAANLCSLTLYNNLEKLTQDLSLESQPVLVNIEINTTKAQTENIDELMEKYEKAITDEMSKIKESDIEREGKKMIMDLVLALVDAMNAELGDIKLLRDKLQITYGEKKMDIEQWISKKPDTSKLKLVKNNLKSMKSKFRHKQADRRDFEEDPDEKEQLIEVEKELEQIREGLHAAFTEEYILLEELSNVARTHFPELPNQYPDLGISSFLETNGLVRIRELEHYDHHALPMISPANKQPLVFKTKFNKKPCALKEYSLDEKFNKDTIRSRMVDYAKCKHQSLARLDGLFFDKGGRKAYLQTDFYDNMDFPEYIKSKPDTKELQRLLHEMLQGLACLHENGYVHGNISPKHVFIIEKDGVKSAVLKEPNFSKDKADRFKDLVKIAAANNFPMSRLETEPASTQLDVYCFGLLMLWAYFPNETYSGDVQPLLSNIVQDNPVGDILECLMSKTSSLRMTAEDALMHVFFEIAEEKRKSPSEELFSMVSQLGDSFAETKVAGFQDTAQDNVSADGKSIIDTSIDEQRNSETTESETMDSVVPQTSENMLIPITENANNSSTALSNAEGNSQDANERKDQGPDATTEQ